MNAAQQPITITAEMTPVINYALYQNELRVMRCVTVENTRETALDRVTLSVSSVPAIIMPYTITLDYIPACNTFRVTDVELLLNVDELANLTEKMTCAVTVSLSDSSGELASQTTEISVLAFDEWQGAGIYPELLTSFVVPNHPALAQVISRAADFLGKWTGDPSFDAYQSQDVNRVLSQSAAIFEAICELQLIYCTAPASFEERGQRVRLCDAVLQQKMGNCLDLSLLYASCMEAVGLHPLLLLTRSHIFSGVWLEDLSFPEAVQYDASVVSKRLALGVNEIAVAESTMMVSGKRCSFDQARSHAEKQLNEDGVECVIDVHRARISGVRPLPQHHFRLRSVSQRQRRHAALPQSASVRRPGSVLCRNPPQRVQPAAGKQPPGCQPSGNDPPPGERHKSRNRQQHQRQSSAAGKPESAAADSPLQPQPSPEWPQGQ